MLIVASRPSTIALADDVIYVAGGTGRRARHARRTDERRCRRTASSSRRSSPTVRTRRWRPVPDRRGRAATTTRCSARCCREHHRPEPHRPGRHDRAAEPGLRGRGSSAAGSRRRPILREGLGVTWLFAAVGAAGRVVVPILIQQAIDKGVDEETGDVQFDLIVKMALIGAVAVIVSGFCAPPGVDAPRRTQRASALRPAGAADRPHPSAEPGDPQRRTTRRARVAGDERHRVVGPVLPMGRARLAARRHADADRRGRDARLQLAARPDRVRRVDAAGVRAARRAVATGAGLRRGAPRQRRHARHHRRSGVGHAHRSGRTAPARCSNSGCTRRSR